MTEQLRSGSYANSYISSKMANDLTPRKTMLILVIVVGCFAVLWPKVFYPMLVGSANQHMKPSPIDKTTGCCDVISETDVNTIKIMSELCRTIIKRDGDTPLTGREIVAKCQNAVLETCGIDISAVLQEQVRLGQSVKQILDEVRSLNGSLCLKYNFGVPPWRLGVPHRITVKVPPSSIRQERSIHLRSELVHPAFRERGRAIPQPQQPVTPSRPPPRIVEGRPGPIPAMRPTLGGAGHVVPPPKQSTGSMGLIMPIYTIGIVIFFTYTVMKIVFKKQPEALYPPVEPDPHFRREVFESERLQPTPKLTREGVSSKLVVNAMSALLDEVDQEIELRRKTTEVADQEVVANGPGVNPEEEDQPSVKVLGMETNASCEGGKKWSRPDSPAPPAFSPQGPEPTEPLQEIFLEGALPAQSHLLVADSATEAQKTASEEDPAVILAGKMTLSVISLDSSENGTDESSNSGRKQDERSSSNVSDEFEKIEAFDKLEADAHLEDQVNEIIDEAQNITGLVREPEKFNLLEEIENEIREIDAKLERTARSAEIEIDEDQIIASGVEKSEPALPSSESVREFVEKEDIGRTKEVEKETREIDAKLEQKDQPAEIQSTGEDITSSDVEKPDSSSPLSEGTQEFVEKEIIGSSEPDRSPSDYSSEEAEHSKTEKDEPIVTEEEFSEQEIIEELIIELAAEKPEAAERRLPQLVAEKHESSEAVSDEKPEEISTVLSPRVEKEVAEKRPTELVDDAAATEIKAAAEPEKLVTEHIEENNSIDAEATAIGALESQASKGVPGNVKDQTNSFIEEEQSKSSIRVEKQPDDVTTEAPLEKTLDDAKTVEETNNSAESVGEKHGQAELVQEAVPEDEKESFDKLNKAIADLASEFRLDKLNKAIADLASEFKPKSTEEERLGSDEAAEDVEEDEEIEYEYEDSDNDVVDEEIRNVDRLDDLGDQEAVEQINGDDLEQSKYVTTSSATMAENEISDEENLQNENEDDDDDEEIEEIIEYVTDDEEEEELIIRPVARSNVNHVTERPDRHD